MTVRAKFQCQSVTHLIGSKKNADTGQYEAAAMRSIKMTPVYGNGDPNHENTKFWDASPSGQLELNVMNLGAAEMFEAGKSYYLDFTPAD
jgi:hypothetical protein